MAIRPDYDIGTVTLVASSANFTTSGSSLQTAAVQAGDAIIAPSGHVLIIASITGQNSGTLFLPCPPDAAGTGLPLRIRFQPDGSRYQGAVRVLIDLLSSGNLEALAGLTGAAGKVPVFTGPGAMDLQDYIADPNDSLASLAALTLAARQILQTDETGDLKQVALAANKALATDANGDVTPIDLGTLGEALLALATGTNVQYVRGDGTLQPLNSLPFDMEIKKFAPNLKLSSAGGTNSYDISANISDSVDGGVNIRRNGTNIANFGVGGVPFTVYGAAEVRTFLTVGGSNNARLYINNSSNTRVAEIGPGAGTGDNNRVGFINSAGGAWYFAGNANFTGTLSKGGGTFLIDHPLDPFNKNLRHGFVEAPRYDLIYRGIVRLVNGRAMVDIDAESNMTSGTFAALTTNAVVTSLQNQDGYARLKPGSINGGSFEIICEDEACTDHVSWVVIAERNDPFVKSDLDQNTDSDGRFVPEFEKEDA